MRNPGRYRATETNSYVCDAHRLTSTLVEPARKQNLIRQRSAADVAESIEDVEQIEHSQSGNASEAHQADACQQNSCDHEPSGTEAIDHPAGEESEQRAYYDFAQRVAGRDLRASPSEL